MRRRGEPRAEHGSGAAGPDRPLRVLYSFPHAIGSAGIGTTAWHQASELATAGHQVVVATASVARPLPQVSSVVRTMSIHGARLPHRVLGVDRSMAWHDWRVARLLDRSPDRYDVVHAWPGAALHTIRAARAAGVPSVREVPNTHSANAYEVMERELWALGLELPVGHSHRRNPQRLAREELEYAEADALLVPSAHVEQTFLDRGHDPARLHRHRYGYDVAMAAGDDPSSTMVPHPFTAVFMGRCEPRKGLHHALEAWHASGAADIGRLLVCGTFVPGYADYLARLLDHPSVEISGFTDDPAGRYREADVLLLPTIEEGSALVTYEAQALGCVPLVSEAAGAHLEHDVHGLVHAPGDVAALTRHLRQVIAAPEDLRRLRRNGLAHRDELTWAASVPSLVAAYRRVAEQAGPARQEPAR